MQITVDVNKDVMQMWTEKTENCESADRKKKAKKKSDRREDNKKEKKRKRGGVGKGKEKPRIGRKKKEKE